VPAGQWERNTVLMIRLIHGTWYLTFSVSSQCASPLVGGLPKRSGQQNKSPLGRMFAVGLVESCPVRPIHFQFVQGGAIAACIRIVKGAKEWTSARSDGMKPACASSRASRCNLHRTNWMFGFLRRSYKLPPIRNFSLNSYSVDFSLERLVPGVDNFRIDVYLSPAFGIATRKIAAHLITRHAGLDKPDTKKQRATGWAKEIDNYKQQYKELMQHALNKGKGQSEIQIENLAQAALLKLLLGEIRSQYESLVGRLKKAVRKSELETHHDFAESPKLKGRLQRLQQERESIQQRVGLEVCGFWREVEIKEIRPMREALFGSRNDFYQDILQNPLLHLEQPDNEFYLINAYDLSLGRRIEDPDKYESLVFFMRYLINFIDMMDAETECVSIERRLAPQLPSNVDMSSFSRQTYSRKIEGWLLAPGNMDRLLNWARTKADQQTAKKKNADKSELERYQTLIANQKLLLDFFYKQFCRNGVIDRIAASYEMQPEFRRYCPPLVPQQIIQYLVLPKSRKIVKNRLRRMKKVYGQEFSLRPLNKKIKAMEQMTAARQKKYLLRFLNAFAHYHRDRSNLNLVHEAMERISIATEDKVINLSRENNTLYEFLLIHEQTAEQAPMINHVVIKADVRGSTEITDQMSRRGLNPASYFSLNFFDPISEILSEYEAGKIFIEGDAIILAIFEREQTPQGWYSVARACGLALNVLSIIRRYNDKSLKFQLPVLELGIGVSFVNKPPAFLFDGGNRIMISPAINQADRLSSCSKTARRLLENKKGLFNLHVFQTESDQAVDAISDDLSIRYNVNGIELNSQGFEKLCREIDLQLLQVESADHQLRPYNLYTGKFPTKSGRYHRLVIREAFVPVLDPVSMQVARLSSQKFYEVCTHPKLYQLARQSTHRQDVSASTV
jgi:hypothetical protein